MGTTTCLLMTLCLGIVIVSGEELFHRPKRSWIIDIFKIEEGFSGPYPRVVYKIEGEVTVPMEFSLSGPGVELEPRGKLFMKKTSTEIYLNEELDYESYKNLSLTFVAKLISNNEVHTRLGVDVEILDINDNPPVFHQRTYTVNRGENDSKGDFLTCVTATDKDRNDTNNGTFNLKIVSVRPELPEDLGFFIEQQDTLGRIKFQGCLDHQKSDKYTILVEAKDRGEMVQLSSTCTVIINIEDGNNHMPIFTGQTGVGSIKERESGVEVLRLQVSDEDTKGTKAWKAKYTIHGDKDQNFRITTDPKTNEGVLWVEKPLDYEDGSLRNLSVNVENEEPYFSCKVKSRPPKGLWDVKTLIEHPPLSYQVTIRVEDVNDPPIFTPAVKNVSVDENVAVGWYLETLTAKDLDRSYANTFLYMKGNDPANWVAVDAKTGKITTTKILDRESSYVKNDVYQVTVLAVDDGKPPMTGTGTLNIHLKDRNDNLPQLQISTMDMCLSDEPSKVNITAYDLDKDPYSGPFTFQLLGNDVKGKWSIDPNHGYTVTLVKENTVYAGHHQLVIEVFDQQGQGVRHNLSITVCECHGKDNCKNRTSSETNIGVSAVVIFMAAILLLLGILLLSFQMTCRRKRMPFPINEDSAEHLIKFNIEVPGTDCKVPATITQVNNGVDTNVTFQQNQTLSVMPISWLRKSEYNFDSNTQHCSFERGTHLRQSLPTSTYTSGFGQGSINNLRYIKRHASGREENFIKKSQQMMHLRNQNIYSMKVPEELGGYAPQHYAEEGDLETNHQLDDISIPDTPFDQDTLLYLGPRFNNLASICKTPNLSTS